MTRQVSYVTETPEPRQVRRTTYACDGCGGEISPEDTEETCAHELVVSLDMDQCVHFLRRRDYCPACLEPIWQAISKLIKADPDLDGDDRSEEED
jgi:hypothetical protein